MFIDCLYHNMYKSQQHDIHIHIYITSSHFKYHIEFVIQESLCRSRALQYMIYHVVMIYYSAATPVVCDDVTVLSIFAPSWLHDHSFAAHSAHCRNCTVEWCMRSFSSVDSRANIMRFRGNNTSIEFVHHIWSFALWISALYAMLCVIE